MNLIPEERCVTAKTNGEKEFIKMMFDYKLISGAWLLWVDDNDKPIPDKYANISNYIDYVPVAIVGINRSIRKPLDSVDRKNIKEAKDAKITEVKKQEKADDLFSFLS